MFAGGKHVWFAELASHSSEIQGYAIRASVFNSLFLMSDLGLTVHTFLSQCFFGSAKLIKLRMYTLLWIVIKSSQKILNFKAFSSAVYRAGLTS